MKKIFSIILWIIISLILIYTSFINSSWVYKKPDFELNKSWNFEINSWEIKIDDKSENSVKYINYTDKILSYPKTAKSEIINNKINIKDWVFLFNFNSLNSNYEINSKWFKIESNWPSSFFVDLSEERIKIISIDNIIKINFLDKNNKEIVNSAYIYPNQYVFFEPNKNFLIKNADLLRVNQLISLWYFNWNILKSEKINKDFEEIFFNKNNKKFLEKLFLYIKIDDEKKENILKSFSNEKFHSIAWESFIVKYDFLLFNKEKKSVYIKNNILKNISETIKSRKFNENISNIKENLEKISKINKKDYEELIKIIKVLSSSINSNKKWDKELISFFVKIIDKNFNDKSKKENLELNASFYKYNFFWNDKIYSEIKNFIEKKSNEKMEEKEKNYFIFFLNKLIVSNLSEKNINFSDTIDFFKNYSNFWINYFSAENEKDETLKIKIIESWIKSFDEIITIFLEKIEKNYFNRSEQWLLEKKSNEKLSKESIASLNLSIKNIYNKFYLKNIENLSTDKNIKENYKTNFEVFNEIILAISDYQKYLVYYDDKNKILIWKVNEDKKVSLSIEKAKKFLNKFNYLNYSESNISIMWESYCENPTKENENNKNNPYCYRIKNIVVWNWNILSFILIPSESNKITNIEINGDKNINNGSYKMDIEEENYKKNSIKDDWKDLEWYKFENFFTNVIINSNNYWRKDIDIIDEDKKTKEDNSIIRTLKNSTILWSNWSLSKVIWILNINYDNLIVNENENWYIFRIENAELNYNNKEKNISYSWYFNSEYKFKNDWKINSFFNPEIDLYYWKENHALNWSKIRISWFIKVDNFEQVLWNITWNIDKISKLILWISNKEETEIKIIYFPQNNRFKITTKNTELYIIWDNIESWILFWKKILEKNEKIDNIIKLLEK